MPREVLMRGAAADTPSSDDGAWEIALAAGAACERVCRTLTRTVGAIGSRALLTRALSQAQVEHKALKEVSVGTHSDIALDGISLAAVAHGESAVIAGLETVLGALLALLGRLIGEDMVARLVAQSAPMGILEEDEK